MIHYRNRHYFAGPEVFVGIKSKKPGMKGGALGKMVGDARVVT